MENSNKVLNPPLSRGDRFSFLALANAVMTGYTGKDATYGSKLAFFTYHLGDLVASEIDADQVDDCLNALRARGKVHNKGGSVKGGTLVHTHSPLANATVNRYRCTLQSVLTWARRKRLMPKGWINPVNDTERAPEGKGRTRYLSAEETDKLIAVSRFSTWNKLTALIMLAVTTGGRRGT